jgi:radical SAM family protein
MKRFPLRLRVALAKNRLLQAVEGGARNSPIRYLRAEDVLHSEGSLPVSHQALRNVLQQRKSIVWIGGSEPLAHAGIGHLARLILQSGHFLFLETDGIRLRPRIHEFQPKPRFYLAVRFLGPEAEHDRRLGRAGAFRAALEGIRAAQLSGFWVCAILDPPSEKPLADRVEFCTWLNELNLDGVLVRHHEDRNAARDLNGVVNPAWARLSRLVASVAEARAQHPVELLGTVPDSVAEAQERSCEEGVQV